jgi:cation-transporting P-type ATPase C
MNAPAQFPLTAPSVVHETGRRLRVRLAWLDQSGVSVAYLRALLEAGEGVRSVRINRKARTVAVHYEGGPAVRTALLARLAALGPAEVAPGRAMAGGEAAAHGSDEGADAHLARLVGSALTLAALPFLPPYLRTALTVASTWKTLWKGARTLVTEGIKVEVLDAIAVGLATSRGQHYTANATHLLLNAGEYLEHQTTHHAEHLVKSLLRPTPTRAWVERDGALVQVAGNAVGEGEVVVVGPGDPLPVDGRVLSGTAQVNQASLTGEGLPVRKEQGHSVLAGSLVEEGRLRVQALRVGDETTTARITRVIEEALVGRSHTQRLAERLADQRVYLTLGLGAGTYALTRDAARLEAVFLVDYSCALKLGTPVAFKSGMYKAAQRGVLFKGAQAMEDLAQVDTVVFDKTGTLTYGQLQVTDVLSLREDDVDQCGLLALVASLEEHANHPLADAVVRQAQAKALGHVDHGHVDFIVAHGLKTQVQGQEVLVGSRHYLEEHEGVAFAPHQAPIERLEAEGKHLLYVAAGPWASSPCATRRARRCGGCCTGCAPPACARRSCSPATAPPGAGPWPTRWGWTRCAPSCARRRRRG